MRSLLGVAFATVTIIASSAFPAASQEQVGQATRVRTAVTGQSGELAVRSPVYRDERISTSQAGLGEFRFADGTRFAVAGGSSVVIDNFIYDSSRTFDRLTLNAARGSFRWISGKSKSDAYEIVTPAGTIGIRGTKLDIYVGPDGVTSVVLLSGAATFCGSNGCEELRRRCDVIVARPGAGVADPRRIDGNIYQEVGSSQAFPFLSGQQRLSSPFNSFFGGSCGMSASAGPRGERGEGRGPSPSGKEKSDKGKGGKGGKGGYGGHGGEGREPHPQ